MRHSAAGGSSFAATVQHARGRAKQVQSRRGHRKCRPEAVNMTVLAAVGGLCLSPFYPICSSRASNFGMSERAPCIWKSSQFPSRKCTLLQFELGRNWRRSSLVRSSFSSASSVSEENCETIGPGLLARVSKLNRPAVILPWEVQKYSVVPQMRSQHASLAPIKSVPDWNEIPGEALQSRLMLVDGKALVYRAYYRISAKIFHGSLKKMSKEDSPENSSWDSTMTTVVALTEVLNLLKLEPSHAAVVFDFPGATFRHTLFPEYKSHRLVTPDTVRQALRDTKHALLGMGIKVIEVPGVEADDVIGTLSLQAVEAGMKVRVASPDKDFFQILSPQLRLLRSLPKGSGFVSFGVEEFNLKYPSLEVSQFVDMQALVGDVADNIPGVRGIGELTARKLILQFGTLEYLLKERDKISQSRARTSLLLDNGEALLSKRLLLLKLDVPVFAMGCTLQSLRCQEPEDGGKGYSNLINAFGAIVGLAVGTDLLESTTEYWKKVKINACD